VALELVPNRWWRRWPPWPLPTREYVAFRVETMLGSSGGELSEEALLDYLRWCRSSTRRSR
jgi:hypothetical protein